MPLLLQDYDFLLPEGLIAQFPLPQRDLSRLLVCHRSTHLQQHTRFFQLPSYLRAGDVLVLNDTRVLPARLLATLPAKGKPLELLLLRKLSSLHWECLAKPARALRLGTKLEFEGGDYSAVVVGIGERGLRQVAFQAHNGKTWRAFLCAQGKMPLPPYIQREAQPSDQERYQTVFAAREGAVASPTAGLHFTLALLQELEKQGVVLAFVTLHVGLGTFRPIGEKELQQQQLHPEYYAIPALTAQKINQALQENRRVVAVGTTVARALESAAHRGLPLHPHQGETTLFIAPPFNFRVVQALLTNFHLPRSSLLMLVSAFAGREKILAAYQEAIGRGYRFYSYGDAMLIV